MRMLLIADLHVGSIKDNEYVYKVTTDIIEKEVIFKKTDAVIILGDYFDRLFKVNEEYVSCAINIMSFLIRACVRGKTKIRIVYGTESHEMNQYKLFNYHFTSYEVDIKVIDTAMEEELFPGVNVLYLPEEYIDNKRKYYKKFLDGNKHYDYIFGHGIIEDGMPSIISVSAQKTNEKQVPRFKSGELAAVADLTVFGHYHCYTNIGSNVYYLGSLFRDSFGEETSKGYGIIEDHKLIFVENTQAYIYKTYEFDPKSDVYQSSDNIMKEVKRIKEENAEVFSGEHKGKIRIIFRTPINVDPTFRENIRDILFNDKFISPMIKESSDDIIADAKEDIDDEYEFILDRSLPMEDKIYRYIGMNYDNPFPMERLISYIKDPLIT